MHWVLSVEANISSFEILNSHEEKLPVPAG